MSISCTPSFLRFLAKYKGLAGGSILDADSG
jgi:hypothetical protein